MKIIYVIAFVVFFAGVLVGMVWMLKKQPRPSEPSPRVGSDAPTVMARSAKHLTGNHKTIFEQLDSLTRRGDNEMAFVIFEDVATERMVQYAGPPILLDLPLYVLDSDTQRRARALFNEYPEALEYEIDGLGSAMQLEMGDDAESAAALSMRVFQEVHQLPDDFELRVTTDKD